MRQGKRFTALILNLVLVFNLTVQVSAAYALQKITAYLNYAITITYIGETQTLRDASGNTVYPISYDGTTYVPVRAVSNMLGIAVNWDQAAQTVTLGGAAEVRDGSDDSGAAAPSGQEAITAYINPGITVRYGGEAQEWKDAAGNTVYPISYEGNTYLPIRAVGDMLGCKVEWDGTTQTVWLGKAGTSPDAEVLGRDHIAYDYAELDWSMADDGYIRARWTRRLTETVICYVTCDEGFNRWYLPFNEWATIPLTYGSTTYRVSVTPIFDKTQAGSLTEEEWEALDRDPLQALVTAHMTGTDAWHLLSSAFVDYEHAPETRAKALEITAGCKTDAEKITAVFEYVAGTIQYDFDLRDSNLASEAAGENMAIVVGQRDFDLDHILASGKALCDQYAILTAGMLRSLGLPCKVVEGSIKTPDGWQGHAWIAVRPETGELDMASLGAGMEPDGEWVRLDPTNGLHVPAVTSDDAIYITKHYY